MTKSKPESKANKELLRNIPSVGVLLESVAAAELLAGRPRELVADCIRQAVETVRQRLLAGGDMDISEGGILSLASEILAARTSPHVRHAINATGIILHTGLGRAVLAESIVDSMVEELKGSVTLAVDRESGKRSERHERVEYILTELTGAEAATVVNNNAAATMLVLAALATGREVLVSRGQLIEIGGSFRLPDVMEQSWAKLVEVGTTNRTHLRDYEKAVTENTTVLMRVHPSNFRVVGFTAEPELKDMAELAHSRGLVMVDDLGAGALLDLMQFGLPHEPTAAESIKTGADVVLFSADKLIGGPQGGVIVGRREIIEKIRRHPLARAFRVDKTCLMALERTLHLFRDPQKLCRENPTYRMLTMTRDELRKRAEKLAADINAAAIGAKAEVADGAGFLGSGSLPMHELPTSLVLLQVKGIKAEELARRLRMDEAAIFTRIEDENVILDVRTIRDCEFGEVVKAVGRAGR